MYLQKKSLEHVGGWTKYNHEDCTQMATVWMATSVGEKANIVLRKCLLGIHLPRQQHRMNTGHNSTLRLDKTTRESLE